jgi:putative ABC transport system substrate-binding protein
MRVVHVATHESDESGLTLSEKCFCRQSADMWWFDIANPWTCSFSADRREFIALIGASVASASATLAQEPGRTYRLGCLLAATRDVPVNKAFLDELRRRGFVEGQNLTVEWRAYGLNPDLISQYAAELVKERVDVIVAAGVVAVRAAQQATKTIPIVVVAEEMLEVGLVTSLARPDGNTTGVSGFVPEITRSAR